MFAEFHEKVREKAQAGGKGEGGEDEENINILVSIV